jgi:AraC-like DNA-binding protein
MPIRSPLVVHANHFQFAAGETLSYGPVESCMQLWCRHGRGSIRANGATFGLTPGCTILLPWRHRIEYTADSRAPFLVSGIHLVPGAVEGSSPTFSAVPHHGGHSAGMEEGKHPLGSAVHVFGREEATELRELGDYVVSVFTREPPIEAVQRLLGRLVVLEWSNACARRNASNAQPDIERLRLFVANHWSKPISVEMLANVLEVSASTVQRLVRAAVGSSPAAWLRSLRVHEAQLRLASSRAPLAKVARELGFADEFHLSRVFKRNVGERPGVWRRRHRI